MQYKRPKPIRRADEDDEDDEEIKSGTFQVKATPLATAYTWNVNRPFTSVEQFEPLVACLERAVQGDVVEIKLSTPGGALHAVLPLLSAIAATKAQVFVHAVSDVASAGTFLLLMADDVFINPYVTVMFHQVTFGAYGQGNHVQDRVDHVVKSSKQLLGDMYRGFFTEDEIQQMHTGKEFWMDKNEFDVRYEARNKAQDAQIEAAIAAQVEVEKKPRKKATKAVA